MMSTTYYWPVSKEEPISQVKPSPLAAAASWLLIQPSTILSSYNFLSACLRFGHLAKKRLFYATFPPFFQLRSAVTQRKKGEKSTKNCSFSTTVRVGLPEIKRMEFCPEQRKF